MKRIGVFLSLVAVLLSSQGVWATNSDEFTPDEREFLDQMEQKGLPVEEIEELRFMLRVRHGKDKQWSEEELNGLNALLVSKWEQMRKALEKGDIDTAVSFFCKEKRDIRREHLSKLSRDQLAAMSRELSDIKMIKMDGSHYAEYDIRVVRDGIIYSYMLVFEKNSDDEWEIASF